jgi:hypothetical protein
MWKFSRRKFLAATSALLLSRAAAAVGAVARTHGEDGWRLSGTRVLTRENSKAESPTPWQSQTNSGLETLVKANRVRLNGQEKAFFPASEAVLTLRQPARNGGAHQLRLRCSVRDGLCL